MTVWVGQLGPEYTIDSGVAFYEQGRIKDTFDYRFDFDTQELFMTKLAELNENEIGSLTKLFLVSSNEKSAVCKSSEGPNLSIKWDMEK